MLAKINFSEFRDRLNESDIARGCFSYEAKQLIYYHLNEEDENYILVKKNNISTIPRSMPKNKFKNLISSLIS